MKLHTVTITGADDKTTHQDLAALSRDYPEVEWGILFSAHKAAKPRYPSAAWISHTKLLSRKGVRFSGHLCGEWARSISKGQFPKDADLYHFQRIQLNISPLLQEAVQQTANITRCLPGNQEYIIQVGELIQEGVLLEQGLREAGLATSILFDASGGRGETPQQWPPLIPQVKCGFAGGLGPDNLEQQLRNLADHVQDAEIWIDMESKVRTENGEKLDLVKVHRCLEIARSYCR